MKIISDEEKNAHWNAVLYEGAKGTVIGLGISYGLVTFLKKKHPVKYNLFTASIKGALWSMPTISVAAFYADEGSVKFDEKMHRSEYLDKRQLEELKKWNDMALSDKIFHKVNSNKYSIIVGAWAASLYGSWRIVDKDRYMTTAQKAVQARVYAQAITVVLLLGTILLSMREQELKKREPAPVPEWKRYLDEQEMKKKISDQKK